MKTGILFIAIVAVAGAFETTASAQVCTETSPGVAQVSTGGVTVKINVASGSVPRVNGTTCGFAASTIEIVGVAGNDTVVLNYVPPSIPVTMDLGTGTNAVRVYTTTGDDTVTCLSNRVDRDDDGLVDLDFGVTTLASVTFYTRGGNDVVDCTSFDYRVKIYGGDGNDTLRGGPFNDTIDGGNGDDAVVGNGGNDRLDGGFGNDSVIGNDGNDTLVAKSTFDGADSYAGGAGIDTLAYTGRSVPVIASLAGAGVGSEDEIADDVDTIKGGKSDDVLDFSMATQPHTLRGGPGNDTLRGGAGADRLFGEAGGDFIAGGGGHDPVLDGGDGNDSMGNALDGFAETVRCGPGIDVYLANSEDKFVACETPAGPDTSEQIAIGVAHSCAILASGAIKCWGYSGNGQLGHGSTSSSGGGPGEMGMVLPATDVGAAHVAVSITAGWEHTCALLDDGSVKCWGLNDQGSLGLGDVDNRGDEPAEMGDLLPAVDLGPGRTARAISSGGLHTCAILDDGSVKCWGWNVFGQLGLGDTANRGDDPGEMGAALPAVDLGTGRTAVAIDAGYEHTCVILDDGSVKCWGRGDFGMLGQGDLTYRGDGPGEMGDALPAIALGTGRSAIEVSTGRLSTCAVLDDRTVKCWGYSGDGQLGYGDSNDRGDQPGEMGDALPVVPLGEMTMSMSSGLFRNCAVLASGAAKCWGWGQLGALGQGDLDNRGDDPGEIVALPAIAFGTGRTVVALVTADGYHSCAKLDDATLKCWGHGGVGQLGYGDTLDRGDEPGEMGDALPVVDLGGSMVVAPPATSDVSTVEALVTDEPFAPADEADPFDDRTDEAVDPDDDDAIEAGGCSSARGGAFPFAMLLVAIAIALARRRRA